MGGERREEFLSMQQDTKNLKVMHLCLDFLLRTETFVYEFVTKTPNTISSVLTYKRHNKEDFPWDKVFSRNDQAPLYRVWDRIYRMGTSKYARPFSFFFKKIVAQEKPDLLHAHFGNTALYGLYLRQRFKIPLMTSFYGRDISELPRKKYYQKMYPKLFEQGDGFLVEGSYMKRCLAALGCPEEKIYIRHIGIDLEKFIFQEKKIESGAKVIILMCCRFLEKKGLEDAVFAFAKALITFPNMELRIIGDAYKQNLDLKKRVEDFIKKQGLTEKIILLGWLNQVQYRKEAGAAHIFLQPSKTAKSGDSEGGAPTVILEMEAAGLPIVSTYHADIPEVVRDKENAYLSPEGDIEDIARNIVNMVKAQDRWPQMGRIGRAHVEAQYNIIKEAEKVYDICRKILDAYSLSK